MKNLSDSYTGTNPTFPELAEALDPEVLNSMTAREVLAEIMPELADEIPEDLTMSEFLDIQRVMAQVTDISAYSAFVGAFPGWALHGVSTATEGSERYVDPGKCFAHVSIRGEDVPVYAFPGVTMAFDETDPALTYFKGEIEGEVGPEGLALLMATADPIFQAAVTSSNDIKTFVLHGGWVFADGEWTPFLVSGKGPEDALAQRDFHRSNLVSRGLMRDRGHPPQLMKAVTAYQARLAAIRAYRMASPENLKSKAIPKGDGDLSSYQIATDPSGWSLLVDRQLSGHFQRG